MADIIRKLNVLIVFVIILTACGKEKKADNSGVTGTDKKEMSAEMKAEKALYNDVMDVHDVIMPEMDNMMKLKSQLKEKLDREEGNDTSTQEKEIENAIEKLEAADESMMQWMRNFEPQDDNENHQEVIDYYTEQKKSIDQVKDEMMKAMGNAKEVLEK